MTGLGGFIDTLGLRRRAVAEGRAAFEVEIGKEHMNPDGVVHGGVLFALVDSAMGAALWSRLDLERGERCATLEIKINYLAVVTEGSVRADATLLHRTGRTAVLEARVHDGADRLVAVATGSFFIRRAA